MAASSAASAQTARQVSLATARARAASQAAQARRAQSARIAKQNAAMAKQANTDASSEPLDILPAAVLAQLTKDQAALQRAAQTEAFTAPVGETIFWEDSGRTGSAMAEEENAMGSFVCRTFIQTVRITENEERATTLACKNPDGVWQASLSRSEMLQP